MRRLACRTGRRLLCAASTSMAISRTRRHVLAIAGYNARSDDLLRMKFEQQAKEDYHNTRRLALIGDMALNMGIPHDYWASGRDVSKCFATSNFLFMVRAATSGKHESILTLILSVSTMSLKLLDMRRSPCEQSTELDPACGSRAAIL